MALRIDRGRIGEARIDHNGTLVVSGALTRTGVFTYKHVHRDGSRYVTRELRHPDDVFAPESVASFIQVPVTDEHPAAGCVTPETHRRLSVGNVGDTIRRDGDFMRAELFVRDQRTIDKVVGRDQRPKRELSCGYHADVVEEAGEYQGERYDRRQTNIRGNHVALVRAGRAGPEVALTLDSADDAVAEWVGDDEDAGYPGDEEEEKKKKTVMLMRPRADAGGEGTRGGKVIGHTSSGRAIYESHSHPSHAKFTSKDHEEARDLHEAKGESLQPRSAAVRRAFPISEDALAHFQAAKKHSLSAKSKAPGAGFKIHSGPPPKGHGFKVRTDAEGEGTRGGKVIGHTSSGRAIYKQKVHASYRAFKPKDHDDAAKLHRNRAAGNDFDSPDHALHHSAAGAHESNAERKRAGRAARARGAAG